MVRRGPAGAAPQLLWAGRAPAAQARNARSVLPVIAAVGAAAARGAGDGGGHHRLTGPDLGCVFAHASGDSTRVRAAPHGGTYLVLGNGTDLRAAGELVSRALHDSDR